VKGDLALHASPPDGREGYVLQLSRPDEQGRVRWREWPSDDYLGAPREGASPVDEILARIHAWSRAGWTLTEPYEAVARWLRG
jgi:hypothetical protein